MEEINYIGEHLLPGRIGHFGIILSFIGALTALISFYFATQRRNTDEAATWLRIGRISFGAHAVAILMIVSTFFYILTNNYFEYHYVWANTSEDLPFEYIFSAFWKDQEGSFMLWMFWHMVLGGVLIWKSGKWEAPVLTCIALAQVFISSMILGIYIGGGETPIKFGSNPFLLLRDVMEAPIFAQADYLTMIEGKGLNPLLQNYWMTIHPPTLFLGFASTIVPFSFAVAGLWTKEYKAWLQPALPWALFSATILGLGILMGGAWAYEALNFGGYWAWDPVENSSLVPWILLIGGLHTHLVARATGQSLRSTMLFYILTFVMILYSTYLTRSGILGDTSVHAFTALGLDEQLLLFIFSFLGIGLFLLLKNSKQIPAPKKEETTSSKEFWMFIGSLVLLLSAAMLTAATSLPIFNKFMAFFNESFEPITIKNPITYYNQQQIWIGILMGLFSGIAQFLRFREPKWKNHLKKFSIHTLVCVSIAGALTAAGLLWIKPTNWQHPILLFAGLFTVVTNLDYLFAFAKTNLKEAGSAFSHIGFGLMIVGVMATGLNQHHISKNELVMKDLLDDERVGKNIILYKDFPMFMSGYEVTYKFDTLINHERFYHVDFKKLDEKGNTQETFTLTPNVLYDQEFTKVAAVNPSTKHYLARDIFTHITSLPANQLSAEEAQATEDSLRFETYEAMVGDTFFTTKYFAEITKIDRNPSHKDYEPEEGDIAIGAEIAFREVEEEGVYKTTPVIVLRDNLVYTFDEHLNKLGVRVRLKEETFNHLLTPEEDLAYQNFTFKKGQKINFNGYQIAFSGFDKEIQNPAYAEKEGDIAVSAIMTAIKDNQESTARPVYLIRDSRPYNLKDEITSEGLHFRFMGVDPKTEVITVSIAKAPAKAPKIIMDIAENAPRNDWLVLEAIVFPGINFFWVGTLMMLLGLCASMIRRIREKRTVRE